MSALNYIGVVVQVFGLAVTALGLIRTYEASGHKQSFWAYVVSPMVETVRAITVKVISLVRRILRRPKPTVLRARSVSATATAGRLSVRIDYGPLKEDACALGLCQVPGRAAVSTSGRLWPPPGRNEATAPDLRGAVSDEAEEAKDQKDDHDRDD